MSVSNVLSHQSCCLLARAQRLIFRFVAQSALDSTFRFPITLMFDVADRRCKASIGKRHGSNLEFVFASTNRSFGHGDLQMVVIESTTPKFSLI
ncbi:hypothetical protein SAMN05192544_110414 [Paraburkholderia hospita]|uniref:Uncharacterized protein n=1 Tax=Paraburkholderia hospita TaxID=169430 RepID=A0AAN1MIQ1_9BURK|nr:hypothetical protein C2L64_09635 [Paraburkholderia hospita]SEI28005.1 hypothetical protein SAMN05192544_110414 [Paraburkholderia hospita]